MSSMRGACLGLHGVEKRRWSSLHCFQVVGRNGSGVGGDNDIGFGGTHGSGWPPSLEQAIAEDGGTTR